MNKSELRSRYKALRAEVTERARREKAVADIFLQSDEYRECKALFLYASDKGEVSTDEIAESALRDGKIAAYPVCTDSDGNMSFYKIDDMNQLIKGMYGLREPDISLCTSVSPDERTLIVVPALAFDKRGFRLGYGKGYYDRYMSSYPCKSVGLAFESCVTDFLPVDTHDKNVDILITDKKKYIFSLTKEE